MTKVSVAGKTLADFPDLVKQIDREKQPDLNPKDMAAGSGKRLNWKCIDCDNKWSAIVKNRTRVGAGCPSCGRKITSEKLKTPKKGESLLDKFPKLCEEWHRTKNRDKTPDQYNPFSPRIAWWKCAKGPDHEWNTPVVKRTRGSVPGKPQGCPCCSDPIKKLSITNTLEQTYPKIAAEWHPTKNSGKTPRDVTRGHGEVWWICPQDETHDYETPVYKRTKRGDGCPICRWDKMATTRKKAKSGRSLAELHPDVAAEWHPTKNGDKQPSDVNGGSSEKYWWKCSFDENHEWSARISNRTTPRLRLGCPHCNVPYHSQIEINLAHELRIFFDFDISAQRIEASRIYNVDIVIEKEKTIIEYDGNYWHSERYEQDTKKTLDLEEHDWTVIRVREDLEKITDKDVVVDRHPKKDAKDVANLVLQKIEEVKNIKLENLEEYLSTSEPRNAWAAKEYYAKLLKDVEQTTLDS